MKDPVLKRPLFAKKAQNQEQIKNNNVPGFALGGLVPLGMAGLQTLGRVALPQMGRVFPSILRTGAGRAALKSRTAQRAAQRVMQRPDVPGYEYYIPDPKPSRFARAGKAVKEFTQRPGVQKGILATEIAYGTAGAEELRRGVMGGESLFGEGPATVTGGLGMLYPGAGFAARTLPKAFVKSTPKFQRALQIGKRVEKATPYPLVGALLSIPAASMEVGAREGVKEVRSENESRLDPKTFEKFSQGVKDLGKNPTMQERIDLVNSFDLTDKQKQRVNEVLGITTPQAGEAPQTPQTPDTPPKTVEQEDNTIEANLAASTYFPSDTELLNMSDEELSKIAGKQATETRAATKQAATVADAGSDDFKKEFASLKEQINSTTGNADLSNLVLMKMASGLLTGKTRQQGISGFGDVFGQALGPTVDTAILLAQAEKEFDNNLAIELIKAREKRRTSNVVKASMKRQFVQEKGDDPLFPVVGKRLPQDENTGQLLEVTQGGPGVGEVFTPYAKQDYNFTEPNEKEFQVASNSLDDLATGIKFAEIINNVPDDFLGTPGAIRGFMDNAFGAAGSFTKGFGSFDDFKAKTSADINRSILAGVNPGGVYEGSELAARESEANKLIAKFNKENVELQKQLGSAFSSGDPERLLRAQVDLVNQRMKYILANANKQTDRITVADVKDAEGLTQTNALFQNPKVVKRRYEALRDNLEGQFKTQAAKYVKNGGQPSFVVSQYSYVRPVQEYLARQNKRKQQAIKGSTPKQKDQGAVLESILKIQ